MGDYVKLNQRNPEIIRERVIVEKHIQEQPVIDIVKFANVVAQTIIDNMSAQQNITLVGGTIATEKKDSFDASMSLERLAESMIVQRGEKASNFDNLGKVRKTEKDQEETDKTIDLLKKLED